MAAWIKMSLGMELGLDPGGFVLDGDPVAPSPKGGGPPEFMFIVTKPYSLDKKHYRGSSAHFML